MSLIQRAATALLGERIDPPGDLPPDSLPEGVTLRRGRLVPWIGGRLARSRRAALAVTLRRSIILEPGATLTAELLEHELTHVRQWRADPLFPVRYALDTLRHGYRDNPYEREAREAAARVRPTSPP